MFQVELVLAIQCFLLVGALASYHPLSDEYIEWINQRQSHWRAGKNFNTSEWTRVRNMASGVWPQSFAKAPVKVRGNGVIPEFFDARMAWPQCASIKQIWDQSHCGSCWAFSAAAAMSDRICIHSKGRLQVFVSAEDLLACCSECGDGCLGGEIPRAWWYWQAYGSKSPKKEENVFRNLYFEGIVTGGLYNSSQGCKDYSLPPCEHHIERQSRPHCDDLALQTPQCVRKCYSTSLQYEDSLTFGGQVKQFLTVEEIQLEILENGPVEGAIEVFDDFFSYKYGVYKRTSHYYIGGHAIKIIGWGTEKGIPYWLCTNSWNNDWGNRGYFKIIRGENHCGVEDQVFASKPRIVDLE
ncbi:cathepsin B isoform X1 [Dendroctonus ponderosae]|uniref:Peptidase C1A papain C-terminal domain-containing protein n=1 Tax=Dendroctonus ponderosae TaxID=77166 RepID=A0AAR5P3E2_DENPD|nr:cathepsin B isoform X1 [Dendroctonus ponderosae]KAH1003818.1 hypothetical protein HUJ04_003672 [Dendroctonus ponderosae]KAH1010392.1 hypothetical protein HUJ05_004695 [Dendroctonus ponderosae]